MDRDGTVNKFENLSKALFLLLLPKQVAYIGDNLANTLVMKKRGGGEGGEGYLGRSCRGVNCPNSHTPPQIPHTYVTTNTIQIQI